jgi:hypothetical protein
MGERRRAGKEGGSRWRGREMGEGKEGEGIKEKGVINIIIILHQHYIGFNCITSGFSTFMGYT